MQAIPMMSGIESIQQMKLIINISAGYPGAKEWVQYAVTPYPDRIRAWSPGAPASRRLSWYPYVPIQLPGLLGAIKGAAEYEKLVVDRYGGPHPDPKYLEALRRMGPQLVAHLLVILLIVMANILYFANKRQRVPFMKRETIIWAAILLLGAGALIWRAAFTAQGMGREYVHAVPVANGQWTQYDPATYSDYRRAQNANPNQTEYLFSMPHTIGLWLAAFFTLTIFSFLYGDNPFYKVAEAILVGVSAAYWMVVAFWDVLVPNLMGKLWPTMIQKWAIPGLSGPDAARNLWYLISIRAGIIQHWRLAPQGEWIACWPLASSLVQRPPACN